MIMLPLIVAQVIMANVFFGNHWIRVHASMARSLAGEITTMLSLSDSGNDDAVATMARDTGINLSVHKHLNRPRRNDNDARQVGQLYQYLRENIKAPTDIYIDTKNRLLYIDVKKADKITTFATSLRRVYSTSTEVFIVWLIGSVLIVGALITPFIIMHTRSISRIARAANRFGRGLDDAKFRPSGSREIRDASVALIQMKERLNRYNRTRTDMLNAVSHDLKSPLTRMRLAIETDTAPRETLLSDIDRMAQMVNGYLEFARGEIPEIEQEITLPPMLNRIARDAIGKKQLDTDFPANAAAFYARPTALASAFQNVIENAAHHAKKKVLITEVDTPEYIEITIDDDGRGIPADKRAEAMRPFVRLDSARGTNTGGTGLGLSIAQTAIENHGGQIELLDSPLGGLRVRIILPV
jgi:two-component system osmolarity sensor histidine kinase EnvZ